MEAKIILKNLAARIGAGNLLVIVIIMSFLAYGFLRKYRRIKLSTYTKGVVTGTSKGAKGSEYLDYSFVANSVKYNGDVPIIFCKKCNYECCQIGDTVFVRYETKNPYNNDLISLSDSTNVHF